MIVNGIKIINLHRFLLFMTIKVIHEINTIMIKYLGLSNKGIIKSNSGFERVLLIRKKKLWSMYIIRLYKD